MRIAYVTDYDANDRINWSGTGNAILRSLREAGCEVDTIGPLLRKGQLIARLKGRFYRLRGQIFDFERGSIPTTGFAKQIAAKLKGGQHDIVFCPGAIPISRLDCEKPIVIWADATFESLITLRSSLHGKAGLCAESIRDGHKTERSAFDRCALLIFASDWAAKSAMDYYGVNPPKVAVVPFGANFLNAPSREDAINSAKRRSEEICHLISVGTDWNLKGMHQSIQLASILNASGLRTQLDIVGCRPAEASNRPLPDWVTLHGFIDKRTEHGEATLSKLYARSHFHVLFSKAEAFGCVFAEANAHAIPNIAFDLGGVSTAVRNDRGGRTFPLSEPLEFVARYIKSALRHRDGYQVLAQRARAEYDDRLNWRVAAQRVKKQMASLL